MRDRIFGITLNLLLIVFGWLVYVYVTSAKAFLADSVVDCVQVMCILNLLLIVFGWLFIFTLHRFHKLRRCFGVGCLVVFLIAFR